MAEPFKGTINVDIRDSEPDWAPFEPPKAPDGAPNVLYIVLDDVGFSAMSCYGGPIETPNIDRIVDDGRPLHAVPHDGAVLADPLVPADRPQPHAQQHGLHHRGGDRVPERERHDPARERDALRDPRRARLEHLHGRQVAPLPDRRDEPRLDAAQLADRPRLRALVRVPRRRDEPVVSRPRLRQPSGRPAAHARTRATTSPRTSPTRRSSSSATRRRSRPRSRSSSTTRRAPATRRTTRRRSGSTSSRASSTWATRRSASRRSPTRRSSASCPPTRSCRRSTRSATETRTGPDGKPFPMLDVTRPWDSLNDDEKRLFARMAEVYAGFLAHADHHIGRLLDYLEANDQLENTMIVVVSDNGASGEGGPERLRQRDEVRQRRPRRPGPEPGHDRRPRRHEDLQPLPERLGDGVQHAVQDVEALRVQRRHQRPVHHLVAGRNEGPRRDPRPVPPRDRPRADDPRRPRRRAAGDDQGAHAVAVRRRQHAREPRRRLGRVEAQDAVLRDARLPLDLARGLEGGHDPSDASPAGATSTTTSGSCTTSTSTARRSTTSPPSSPTSSGSWSTSGSRRPARTAPSRSTTARRSRSCRTPRPQLDRSARPLRLLPGHGARSASGRPSTRRTARS